MEKSLLIIHNMMPDTCARNNRLPLRKEFVAYIIAPTRSYVLPDQVLCCVFLFLLVAGFGDLSEVQL